MLIIHFSYVGALQFNQWQQEPWEPVDNRRIFMHGLTNQGDLNPRQNCAAESSAKHNYNRSVQIFVRIPPENDQRKPPGNTTWHSILKNYPNVNVIFFDESYFKNTALANWYNRKEWGKRSNKNVHLSEFARIVSLFRGGGLFIDMDTVVTLKPLDESKWRNFFVTNGMLPKTVAGPSYTTSSEIFHLVYGHHLSDEVILKMGDAIYNPLAPAYDLLNSAIQESIISICSNKQRQKRKNQCKDVQLFSHQDVFVPHFKSVFWSPLIQAIKQNITKRKIGENRTAIQTMIKSVIESITAPLFKWKSYGKNHLNEKIYKTLLLFLLPNHCPITVKYFSSLDSWML